MLAGSDRGPRGDLAGRREGRLLEAAGRRIERRTRIERTSNPEAVRALKAVSERDITGGDTVLAAQAIEEGLVDECHLFLAPIIVGGGKRALPENVRVELELLDERRFASGTVHVHNRTLA